MFDESKLSCIVGELEPQHAREFNYYTSEDIAVAEFFPAAIKFNPGDIIHKINIFDNGTNIVRQQMSYLLDFVGGQWTLTASGSGGGGAVASVNGQVGTVVLTAQDVNAATAAQGAKADTAVQPADLATHTTNTNNPHATTKAQIGLGDADNTSDANKPISTATQTALDGKIAKAGDVMTGALTLNDDPTTDKMAATKKYVDDALAASASKGLDFKGFISTTEPTEDVREGNLWYQPAAAETTPDTTFPWTVKTYTAGAWSTTTTTYTPIALDLWSNADDEHGYYYFGQAWNQLDFNGSTFDNAYFDTASGTVKIKAEAITNAEVAANAEIDQSKIADLPEDLDAKADKVSSATEDDIVILDATGNLVDSGVKTSDFSVDKAVLVTATDYTSLLDLILDKGVGYWKLATNTYNSYTDIPVNINPTENDLFLKIKTNDLESLYMTDMQTTQGLLLFSIVDASGSDYTLNWIMNSLTVGTPDYRNQETINRISGSTGGTWTCDRDGYVNLRISSNLPGNGCSAYINNKNILSTLNSNSSSGTGAVVAVRKGDVITLTGSTYGSYTFYCYFIPAIAGALVPVNNLITMGPPDYANREAFIAGNRTMDRDGYLNIELRNGSSSGNYFLFVNGVRIFSHPFSGNTGATPIAITIQVKKGDVITAQIASGSLYTAYIPPVINAPVYLESAPLIDYSTVEQDTGRKWIDGRTIYQKTVLTGSVTLTANTNVEIFNHVTTLGGNYRIIKHELLSNSAWRSLVGDLTQNASNTRFNSGTSGIVADTYYVTVWYVK